ncbi:MAG TPA: hypothetical protein PKC20_08750 [Burkholderiaceae bacterium]|nr:hypothetical protein [Burkholderiaceae bacterium]
MDHVLGDVLRVVADALDRLHDEHQRQRVGHRRRIVAHAADQRRHHLVAQRVDLGVARGQPRRRARVLPHERVDRAVQHLDDDLRHPADRLEGHRQPAVREGARLQRDLLGLVADPLEVVDRVDDRDDLPQVHGDRLAQRDHPVAAQVGLDVQLVDDALVLEHLGEQAQVAVAHGIDRADDLALDEPAHRRHRASHRVDVGVELPVGVVGHRRLRAVVRLSRSAR